MHRLGNETLHNPISVLVAVEVVIIGLSSVTAQFGTPGTTLEEIDVLLLDIAYADLSKHRKCPRPPQNREDNEQTTTQMPNNDTHATNRHVCIPRALPMNPVASNC